MQVTKSSVDIPAEMRVARQLSVQQIHERNKDLITGHTTLGSVALRSVVQRAFQLLPHEQA